MFTDEDLQEVYAIEVGRGGERPFWSGVFDRDSYRVFDPVLKPAHTGTRPKRAKVRSEAERALSSWLAGRRAERSRETRAAWVLSGRCVDCGKQRMPKSRARCEGCLDSNRDKARARYTPKTGKRLGQRIRRAVATE
jgi:hypothetical protein